ncbi:MAG: heavy-metal-associated domain-containing protein [Phycisphaerales bacterium]
MGASCKVVLKIMGMRNNTCRERIADVLRRVDGVQEAQVSLIRAEASVSYGPPCVPEQLVRAVIQAEYSAAISGTAD